MRTNNPMEETNSPDSPEIDYVCGDPQVDPRVGDEYQVEVPPLISELQHTGLLLNSEVIDDALHFFQMGLTVPIMWINNGDDLQGLQDDNVDINESLKSIKARRNRPCRKNKGQNRENFDEGLENQKKSKSSNLEAKVIRRADAYEPVPGIPSKSWEVAEMDCFLLGLYTFGKNFVQVRKFMETKGMEDILWFYYAKFYKSNKYHRWSDSRKTRSRKCVHGRKLFLGWRQQELLSRLIPGVSEDSQRNRLLNVSKSFAEGNIVLEKYIFSLKTVVGIRALVDAVAIGKGKEDLTNLAMDPIRTKQWFTISSDPSASKTYSSLTSSEIIKQLTGGSRLSKARCNDIFWEAVWPRLLARGWHSEQPKSQGYVTSKGYLVFLLPGIKKFSRAKLVKGDHYFDSVSDILSKVASEPELLEFESEETKDMSSNAGDSSDQSDPNASDRRSHVRYLRSPVSKMNSSHMKFTVVDTTSLAIGGKLCDLKELRFAAADPQLTSKSRRLLKNDGIVSGDSAESNIAERTFDMLLDGEKSIRDATDNERETDCLDLDNTMGFTVVDTSLDHGGKSSGLRKLRFLPVDSSHTMKYPSKEHDGTSCSDSLDEHEQNQAGSLMKEDKDESTEKNSKPTKSSLDSDGTCSMGVESCMTEKILGKNKGQNIHSLQDGHQKRVINHKFTRRAEASSSVDTAPLLKRRRLSACIKTEVSRLSENFSIKSELKQMKSHSPVNTCDARTEIPFQEGSRKENILSGRLSSKDNAEEESSEATNKGDSFGIGVNEGNKEKPQTRFSFYLDLTSNDSKDFENGQCIAVETQDSPGVGLKGSCFISDLDKLDSKELVTIHDTGSTEQQPEMNNIPRRQSRRKRPLTTRVLESLEMVLFMAKKQKSTKPRKRESPLKKKAGKARSKGQVISDDAMAEPEIVDKEVGNGSERGFVVKEAETGKPLDRIEDKCLVEEPKRPPIMLKLSFKRS